MPRAPSPEWWRGPRAYGGAQAKPTVTYESMSSHAASNAVATVLLSLMPLFLFLDVGLHFWHDFSRFNAFEDLKRPPVCLMAPDAEINEQLTNCWSLSFTMI